MRPCRVLGFAATILLASCQASVAGPAIIDLQKLGIRFTYPEQVIQREENAEYLLKASRAHVFASSFKYRQTSTGAGDWTMTPKIREALIATKSCDILTDKRVSLPVNTRKTMLCDIIRTDEDAVLITLIGHGVPNAAMDFLQSAIILLRPQDFIVVSGVVPFPLAEEEIVRMTAAFPASHPNLPEPAWPNKGFHFLAIDVRAYLDTQLNPLSEEVTKNRNVLLKIAKSVMLTEPSR